MKQVKILLCILLSVTLLVGLIMGYIYLPKQTCEQISVVPHTNNECIVIGQEDVEEMLANAKIEVIRKQQKDIDLGQISSELKKNPFVEKVNFVHFAGGKLVIDYKLRDIVLNVFTLGGENYLVDEKGIVLPFTMQMTDYLMVVNGNVSDDYKVGNRAHRIIQEALLITKKIYSDDFYKAQFRQIYINSKNELELMATIGGQTVLLGNSENIDEKLSNVRTVYANALPHKGYKTYSKLDARFKNRIIATKHN